MKTVSKGLKIIILVQLIFLTQFALAQPTGDEQSDSAKVEKAPSSNGPKPFLLIDEMPEYPGGEAGMFEFISTNIMYPKEAKKHKIQGRVEIQFVVDENGKVVDTKVLKGIGYGCDEEALRVVNAMPKWKPAIQKGKPVRVRFVIPIRFKLN